MSGNRPPNRNPATESDSFKALTFSAAWAAVRIQQEAEHEITKSKVKCHDDLPAGAPDYRVHLDPGGDSLFLREGQEVLISAASPG